MAGELKLLPFLGEGHICMQTAAAFCLVRAGLLPSFPLGIARRERRETVAWTASKIEDDMLAYVCRADLQGEHTNYLDNIFI